MKNVHFLFTILLILYHKTFISSGYTNIIATAIFFNHIFFFFITWLVQYLYQPSFCYFTFTISLAFRLFTVLTVITVFPFFLAFTTPLALTEATDFLLDLYFSLV